MDIEKLPVYIVDDSNIWPDFYDKIHKYFPLPALEVSFSNNLERQKLIQLKISFTSNTKDVEFQDALEFINHHKKPYLHIFFYQVKNQETYNEHKKKILDHILNNKQKQMIVILFTKENLKIDSILKSYKKLIENIQNDIQNLNLAPENLAVIKFLQNIENLTDLDISEHFLKNFIFLIEKSIESRRAYLEDSIKLNLDQKNKKGWDFLTYFLQKEDLAYFFQNLQMFSDAYNHYQELTELFLESEENEEIEIKFKEFNFFEDKELLTAIYFDYSKLKYRKMILEQKISEFLFLQYLLARKITLLRYQNKKTQVSEEIIIFLKLFKNSLKKNKVNEILASLWLYFTSKNFATSLKKELETDSFSTKNKILIFNIASIFKFAEEHLFLFCEKIYKKNKFRKYRLDRIDNHFFIFEKIMKKKFLKKDYEIFIEESILQKIEEICIENKEKDIFNNIKSIYYFLEEISHLNELMFSLFKKVISKNSVTICRYQYILINFLYEKNLDFDSEFYKECYEYLKKARLKKILFHPIKELLYFSLLCYFVNSENYLETIQSLFEILAKSSISNEKKQELFDIFINNYNFEKIQENIFYNFEHLEIVNIFCKQISNFQIEIEIILKNKLPIVMSFHNLKIFFANFFEINYEENIVFNGYEEKKIILQNDFKTNETVKINCNKVIIGFNKKFEFELKLHKKIDFLFKRFLEFAEISIMRYKSNKTNKEIFNFYKNIPNKFLLTINNFTKEISANSFEIIISTKNILVDSTFFVVIFEKNLKNQLYKLDNFKEKAKFRLKNTAVIEKVFVFFDIFCENLEIFEDNLYFLFNFEEKNEIKSLEFLQKFRSKNLFETKTIQFKKNENENIFNFEIENLSKINFSNFELKINNEIKKINNLNVLEAKESFRFIHLLKNNQEFPEILVFFQKKKERNFQEIIKKFENINNFEQIFENEFNKKCNFLIKFNEDLIINKNQIVQKILFKITVKKPKSYFYLGKVQKIKLKIQALDLENILNKNYYLNLADFKKKWIVIGKYQHKLIFNEIGNCSLEILIIPFEIGLINFPNIVIFNKIINGSNLKKLDKENNSFSKMEIEYLSEKEICFDFQISKEVFVRISNNILNENSYYL